MGSFRDEATAKLRADIGGGQVISALSGGVDSSVASVLIHKAIGDMLHYVFDDTGLLRQGEAEQITSLFHQHYDIPLTTINA